MALDLFESDFETESYKVCGFFSRDDFLEFGRRIGIPVKRVNRIIDEIIGHQKQVHELLDRSFLTPDLRIRFSEMIDDRFKAVRYSYKK